MGRFVIGTHHHQQRQGIIHFFGLFVLNGCWSFHLFFGRLMLSLPVRMYTKVGMRILFLPRHCLLKHVTEGTIEGMK